jgi:hypothetical protein
MTINLDDYEKALTVFALRQYATSQLQAAVTLLTEGKSNEGKNAMERGETATAIANRLGQ